MSRIASPLTPRRLAAGALTGALAAALLIASPADATIVKPPGSRVTVILNGGGDGGAADPATAPTSGRWGTVGVATGTTAADFGCHADDVVRVALTTASTDGSTERPAVDPAGTTPGRNAFPWVLAGTGNAVVGETPANMVLANGAAKVTPTANLFTAAGWEAGKTGGIRLRAAGATDGTGLAGWSANMSVVLFCSPGLDATGDALVSADGTGHAITSWLHFHPTPESSTPGSTTIYPSAGWEYYADAPAPTVETSAANVTRSSATLTASLTDPEGATYTDATGSLLWYAGETAEAGHEQGSPVAVDAGVAAPAAVDLSGFPAGSDQEFVAVYTPDAASEGHYATGTSEVLTVRVGLDAVATTTSLAVTGSTTAGATQTLTATVAPAAAGTVTFTDGGSTLGTATVSGGTASLTRQLAVGSHSLTAAFQPGNAAQFRASTSTAKTVTIAKAESAVTLTVPKATYGQATTVAVGVRAGGQAASGNVSVTLDGQPLGTLTLSAAGTAQVALPATTGAGQHALEATYAGTAAISAGTATASVTVAKASTTTKVAFNPKKVSAAAAKKGKVKIVVTVAAPGLHPTGKVVVRVGAKKLPATLSRTGTATVRLPKSNAKSIKVTASYAGDANFASSSRSATLKVRR
jgi:hypothetical protein